MSWGENYVEKKQQEAPIKPRTAYVGAALKALNSIRGVVKSTKPIFAVVPEFRSYIETSDITSKIGYGDMSCIIQMV